MRLLLFLFIACFLTLNSCSKKTGSITPVQLRIENLNSAALDSVVVQNPAGKQVYYNIVSGATSDYKTFPYIYNYAYIKAYYKNQTLVLQPIDYVGEKKLEEGRFTYRLYVISNFAASYLSVDNQKD